MRILISKEFINLLIAIGLFLPFIFLKEINLCTSYDFDKLSDVGGFLAGTTGLLWGLASVLLIYKSFHQSQIQQFENVYFGMLTTLREITNSIKGEIHTGNDQKTHKELSGNEYISAFIKLFKGALEDQNIRNILHFEKYEKEYLIKKEGEDTEEFDKEFILDCYTKVYSINHANLGHVFRYIFNIIKFVDQNNLLSSDKKKFYINFIQAQSSNDLLGLIFYNVHTENGKSEDNNPKFLNYVKQYGLLENIDPKSIIQLYDFQQFFPGSKFKTKLQLEPRPKSKQDWTKVQLNDGK